MATQAWETSFINQWPSASPPPPLPPLTYLKHHKYFSLAFTICWGFFVVWVFFCQTSQSQCIWTMCIFLYSAKGTLPLMRTNGSIANFTLSLAKLSSITGWYCILYSSGLQSLFFTGVYLDCAQKSKKTHTEIHGYVSDAGPSSLLEKMGLITKKYFFFMSKADYCITIQGI